MKKKTPRAPPLLPSLYSPMLHRRWVLFLLIEGHTNEVVRRLLAMDDLPCPGDAELDAMRVEHTPPKGFKPQSEKHAASVTFLKKVGLESLFRESSEVKQAVAILRRSRSRELTEAALITGVPATAISLTLRNHLRHEVAPLAIEAYRQTFFDTSLVARVQLKVLVAARVRLAVQRVVTGNEDEVAARRVVAADARMVASALPALPLAFQAVLLALGLSPGRQELGYVLGQMETISVIRAGQALLRGEPDDERRAEAYTGVLRQVQAIREMVAVPQEELQKKLSSFTMVSDKKPVVTLSQLLARGDSATVDLLPMGAVEPDLGGERDDEGVIRAG